MQILTTWLIEHDKTQKWLAEQLGCTPGLVSQWCTGRTVPTVDWIERLSEVTGMPIEEMVKALVAERREAQSVPVAVGAP